MSKSSTLSRFIALLLMVVLLASPLATVAQEADSGVVEDSLVFAMDSESNPEEGNPEEGNPEASTLEEGNPEVGIPEEGIPEEGTSEEGNPEVGIPEEGNPEEGNSEEGTSEEGNPEEGNPEEGTSEEGAGTEGSSEDSTLDDPENNGEVSLVAEPGTGDPAFYCNFQNLTGGDVTTWWANNNVAPDCIDLAINNAPDSCSLTASFTSYVFASVSGNPAAYGDLLYWFETDSNGVVLRPAGGGAPLNWGNSGPSGPGQGGGFTLDFFEEDYNGGTAYVLINFASPENQIAAGLDQIDLDHWRTTSAGVRYAINTDCEDPIPVEPGTGDPAFYCNFQNLTGGDVATWWANNNVAPDCIDLAINNAPDSCSLTATFTSWVYSSVGGQPFAYRDRLTWYETDANGVVLREGGLPFPSPILATGNSGPSGPGENGSFTVSFPEDHNGGTTWVLINFGSPENQIAPGLDQIDLDHWRTTSTGRVYEINTDCEDPIPVDYCDYSQLVGAGDVFSWLLNAPEGAVTDCIDVGAPVLACGSLNIPFSERVQPFVYTLYWAIGDEIPADDTLWNATWPITFAEDEHGGSVDVIVFIGGPEDDYYHFANEDPYPYPYPNIDRGDIPARSLGGGVEFTIDTDCTEPKPEEPKPEKPKPEVPKPEDSKDKDKAPVVTQLPSTGAGSNSGSMIALAALAALALAFAVAGAGRFFTSRKR